MSSPNFQTNSHISHISHSSSYKLVSFEVLLFSNANWTVSSDNGSINMSVASFLQMRIVPLFFGFFEAIFLPAKSTRFWRPKAHFRPQSLRFRGRVVSAKTRGTWLPLVSARGPLFRRAETTSWGGLGPPKFFGTRAEKFAFTRQKSSVPYPTLLARVPKFRSAAPKMNVV